MNYVFIPGICFTGLDVPKLVTSCVNLFKEVESVLDIGAGYGRFLKWFITNTNVKYYVAIEPYPKFVNTLHTLVNNLRNVRETKIEIVPKPWQEVRNVYLSKEFDVVILWNVIMFLDLRPFHNTSSFLDAILKEFKHLSKTCRKYMLIAFEKIKNGIPELTNEQTWNTIIKYLCSNNFQIIKKERYKYVLSKEYLNSKCR